MLVFPNIKINIGLYVTEKRNDGYHNLLSCFMPVPWNDVLEITEAPKLQLTITGLNVPGRPEENLCYKAYKLLNKDYQLPPVHIHLHKIIPMGAGLGGGSSDASFTLKALSNMFHLFLDDSILEEYALRLGSDCPFFIKNEPSIATQRGEVLDPIALQLKDKYIILINPGIHISTKEAFAGLKPAAPEINLRKILETLPIEHWKDVVKNDFETSLSTNYPEINQIKTILYQSEALYASMSGSGSTVYGIFDQPPKINTQFPDHWLQHTAQFE
jgi:4-diphosphocytidyl-2-C-methyl-D-erythritol kinase